MDLTKLGDLHLAFCYGFAGGVVVGLLLMVWIYHKCNIVKLEDEQ